MEWMEEELFAEVILGDINPSGKLPYTVPVKLEDY